MLVALLKLLKIRSRERPKNPTLEKKYRITLDMKKVKPGASEGETSDWLMKMGFTPTGNPSIWKVPQSFIGRVPKSAVIKSEKL